MNHPHPMPSMKPLRIVLYGSSLFLTALEASIQQFESLHLIPVANEAQPAQILQHAPAAILYQADLPPVARAQLLAAGVCCAELDPQHSQITIFHPEGAPQQYSLEQAQDLVSALSQRSRYVSQP